MKNLVSVIIPMHNASNHIEKCLLSISKQSIKDFEVILVDAGSTDNTVQKAKKYPFRIIKLKNCINPAKARNYGAKNASGNIFVFVDSDIVLKPDSIERIASHISEAGTDTVSGIYTKDNPPANFFSQLQNLILVYRFHGCPEVITFTNSAFCAIKRNAFEAVGGYNEKMSYYEDIEIGHRLTKKGYVCRMDPTISVTHLKYFNHLGLIRDYLKKGTVSGAYKRRNFAQNLRGDELLLHIKISGVSTGFVLLSVPLIPISAIPLLIFLGIYSISVAPLLLFLIKNRGLYFGLRSYFMCFEIFLVSLFALTYGTLAGGENG